MNSCFATKHDCLCRVQKSGIGRGLLRREMAEKIQVIELNGETAFRSLRFTSR